MPTALLVTFGSFALILLLARLRVPLAASIFVGTLALAVGFGQRSPGGLARILLHGVIDPKTVCLAIIVATLLTLSELMRSAGQLERIVDLARAYLRRPAVSMAAMPILIGLIPMPGGAIFSASMVQTAAGKTNLSGGRLSAINYWFRHIWEYWWPLYPAVLVATEEAKMDFGAFAALQWPLTVFMLLAGLWLFRKTHPDLRVARPRAEKGTGRRLFLATSSVWGIVVVFLLVKLVLIALCERPDVWALRWLYQSFPGFFAAFHRPTGAIGSAMYRYAPVLIGLLASIAWTAILNRLSAGQIARILKSRAIYAMVLLLIAVMVFQFTLNAVDAPRDVAENLRQLSVPPLLVVALLPLIAGIVTGLGVGFVGSSFPIVMGLLAVMPDRGAMAPYVMFAYAFGHMGMMLSPMHLCQVVSNRYFKTGYAPVYAHMAIPAAMTLAMAGGYFLFLKWLLN